MNEYYDLSEEIRLIKTDNTSNDFLRLIELLDADLESINGVAVQRQLDKFNKVDNIKDVVVVCVGNNAAACGSFKEYCSDTVELKRMFTLKEYRRRGLAKMIIESLEDTARAKGYTFIVLETGYKHLAAISLYKKCGYDITENFAPYIGNENSVCMRKKL